MVEDKNRPSVRIGRWPSCRLRISKRGGCASVCLVGDKDLAPIQFARCDNICSALCARMVRGRANYQSEMRRLRLILAEDKDLALIQVEDKQTCQVEDKQTWRLRLILVEDKDLAPGCAWTWPPFRLKISKRGGCAPFFKDKLVAAPYSGRG